MAAKFFFCGLMAVCLIAPALHAQGVAAGIQGTVHDSTGAVVPSATITVVNLETNLQRTGASNGAGVFSVPDLPPGKYRVRFLREAFQTRLTEDTEHEAGW